MPNPLRSLIAAELDLPESALEETDDPIDTVTLDVPLFIRLLEFAREDAKSDVDLHNVLTNTLKHKNEGVLGMGHYDLLVQNKPAAAAAAAAAPSAEVTLLFKPYSPKAVGNGYELALTSRDGVLRDILSAITSRSQKFGYRPLGQTSVKGEGTYGALTGPGGRLSYGISADELRIVFTPH